MREKSKERFAVVEKVDGVARVKAVATWNRHPQKLPDASIRIHEEGRDSKFLNCHIIDGQFIRPENLWRKDPLSKTVDKIVWSYHDYGFGNSLAHIGRETVRWLKKLGYPVMISPWDGRRWEEFGVPVATAEDLKTSLVVIMARVQCPGEVLKRFSQVPLVAAYYMTESTLARAEAVDTLEAYDIVFTPSSFCQKSLVDAGLSTPAVVWGHGFDPEYFSYVEPKPNRPFTFLWFGDENRRKGYDVFLEAFKKLDIPNVRAWVRGPGTGIINSISAKYKGDPRIVWDTGVTPPAKIKDMVAEVDVLVSPLRGEGFLLPALEMMASGRPVIMTRFSGPMDFGGGDDLTYWIDTCGSEPGQNDWGVQKIPSMEHLLTLMRHCATHPEEVRQRGREACRVAHLSWRWDQKVLEFLPAIRKMIPDCRI